MVFTDNSVIDLLCKSVQILAFKYPIVPYYEKLKFGKVSTVKKFEKDDTVLVTQIR